MGRTISIRFDKSGKISKVTGKPGSKQESESLDFGEAFLKAFPSSPSRSGEASTQASIALPDQDQETEAASSPPIKAKRKAPSKISYQSVRKRKGESHEDWALRVGEKPEKLPSRPTHSKPAGAPRYDQQMDARTWLRANGYQDIAERIDRLLADWKEAKKRTRRDWWLVLAGSPSGRPSMTGGKPWPMLAAFRKRQGYPVHTDAIERGPHELAPNVFAQKRWGEKFKRATK